MSALLDDIINLAIDGKQPLPDILRKCLLLGHELKNDQLKTWANQELNGYEFGRDVPEYRIIPAPAKGNFIGPFHAQYNRHVIPSIVLEQEHRKFAERVYLLQSVSAYVDVLKERDANPSGSSLSFPWNANMVVYYQEKLMQGGFICHAAWQEVPTSAVAEMLDTIRNRTLNMALQIKDELGTSYTNPSNIEPGETATKIQSIIFQNTGGNTTVAFGQANVDVSDVSTLATCVAAVRSGSTTNVRFTATVNCSGNATCLVDLTNVHGPVTFFGAPGVSSGFLRTDSYTYPIFNVSSASDITIANLTFDEGPDDPACAPYQMNYPCQSTIEVSNQSSNILLKQVSILHSKDMAIAFSATQGITIQDSQIQDAGIFGIWTDRAGASTSSNISITNNLIQDVKMNGIFLSYTQNTTISGNTLKHNHHVALFDTCGGLCPGGQIIMQYNTSLLIYSNQIIDGQIDLNNATGQTTGIEIADPNQDVRITNNIIANNLGTGIGTDPGTTGTNFQITGNKIYNNGTNLYLLNGTGFQESGDCFTQ